MATQQEERHEVLSDDTVAKAEPYPPTVKKAAENEPLTEEEQADALDWFLGDEEEDSDELPVKKLQINVSTTARQKWVEWHIRPLNADEMRQIDRMSAGNRADRRSGTQADATKQNLLIVVEATVYPNLREIALGKQIQDATYVLKHRFRDKPGLVTQIAAEVMLFSGFDSDDVREAVEVRAAGNS